MINRSANPLAKSALLQSEISHLFEADSPLARFLSGFSPREGQAAMAGAVAGAIANGENLVVEAGTGTGKTLAYLIPALLSGGRVILSTGTKTLQDQLFHRDLPVVTEALGRPSRIVQLKGRSNYLCLHRLQAFEQGGADKKLTRELNEIRRWSLATRSGDIAETENIAEDSALWPRVTSTQENCLGNKCEFFDRCHVVAARQAAMAADIVVVNHHLLLADMVLKDEGFGELLPGCDAVIIDEAHQFPEIAQGFFNVNLNSLSLLDLAEDLRAEMRAFAPAEVAPGPLADALVKAVWDLRLTLPADATVLEWEAAGESFSRQIDALVILLDDTIALVDGLNGTETAGLIRCRERACAAIEKIENISGADETAGLRWLGLSRRGVTLNYTPIDIASGLRKLFTAQGCAWIFTSATLAIGDDFEHFERRMGLVEPARLVIASPFNYADAGLLYLPTVLPDPASPGYTAALLTELRPLIDASQGRAFLLFTSHRALREAADILRADESFQYPLLVQGEAPRSKLLEHFTQVDMPVLLGTASFWEGVDIRGDGLVLVAIDKLPFASPGDPMLRTTLEAIAKNGGKPFMDYQLPQAILTLKQGVGRLIRDSHDFGVVVIGDPRIATKSYGRRFLGSLPPFGQTTDRQRAIDFLHERQRVA
jgi:ATP-dependent DNA helicase DinG